MPDPQQQDPRVVQQLIDLYQQVDRLTRANAENMARISTNAGNANKEISRLLDELNANKETFNDIATSLKSSIQEFSKFNTVAANTKKTFGSIQSIASKLLSDQSGFSRLSEKELKNLRAKLTLDAQNLNLNLQSGLLTAEQAAETEDVLRRTADLIGLLEQRIKKEKEVNKAIGVTGNALKGLSKIPGIGSALNTDEAIEKMKDLADSMQDQGKNINSFSNKLKIAGVGLKTAFGGIKESLTDPVTVITFFVNKALEANKQVVELGKQLGYAGDRANQLRENLALTAGFSSNINVNTQSLTEAFGQLAQATGLVYEYSANQLETQVKLTKQVGLQAEEAAQAQKFAVITGQTSEATYKSFVRGLAIARNQLKVGINFKTALAEALKVSGQLAANLGYNPERISKAIVAMKAFGTTLEQTKSQGEALLNFESSIENELKAELLTGKQLNLERARAAALQGDQVTLAKELANQGMTLEKFQKMNVLAQKSYAEAIGLSADQLSDQLQKQKLAIESGKSLAQITEEEAKQALERQNIQEKFGAALLKIQDVVGNLVAGPFGQLFDLISSIASILTTIISPVITGVSYVVGLIVDGFKTLSPILLTIGGLIAAMNAKLLINAILSVAQGAWKALGGIIPAGPILATAATLAGVGLVKRLAGPSFAEGGIITNEINNATIGEAGPEAIIPLNSPKAEKMLGNSQIDLSPMITAINDVKAAINNLSTRPAVAYINGKDAFSKEISTTSVQKSIKPA